MFKTLIRGNLTIVIKEGRGLSNADNSILPSLRSLSDPWLEIVIDGLQILATKSITNTLNPEWNAKAIVPLCNSQDCLLVKVWENDFISTTFLGEATIPLAPMDELWEKEEWVPLSNGKGEIHISIRFVPFKAPSKTLQCEPINAEFLYFPPRRGGSIQLYQDAHVRTIPDLMTNTFKEPTNNTFEDMADAFEKAKKFIYIAGWSVWTELQMRRDGRLETLGELLNRRAKDGVRVLIMLWNEKFSVKLCRELFGTHVSKTMKYFKDSDVTVVSVRRQPLDSSRIKEQFIETIYTHHMKIIIADCPDKGLIGFVGGYDLTDGRWDTPEHPIWETLKTIHQSDFYNGFVTTVTSETGPREPWHDMHVKVESQTAYDLLTVFEERWKRQASEYANLLIPFTEEEIMINNKDTKMVWHSQILRSSNSDSSIFNSFGKGLTDFSFGQKDCSVQHGLISLIRTTRKFLYIESQYFIGSSFAWETEQTMCASNLVPLEIAEQISFGIKTGKPIRVYILIPLCPEGDPTSRIGGAYMCDILHWQYLTIQMIYRQIASTIQEVGLDTHPEDYLIFLCLGKKQERQRTARSLPSEAKQNTDAFKWQQRSRFIVYVHSKMAVADDARIIIGSANLNQRSLDGSRDTECSIAASQVNYSSKKDEVGKIITDGAVADFRRCLWFEHTGGLSEQNKVFGNPSSKECINAIKDNAQESLFNFMNDTVDKEINFRFMKYPLMVNKDGKVEPYPEIPNIPDFGLPVTGKRGFIPKYVTT